MVILHSVFLLKRSEVTRYEVHQVVSETLFRSVCYGCFELGGLRVNLLEVKNNFPQGYTCVCEGFVSQKSLKFRQRLGPCRKIQRKLILRTRYFGNPSMNSRDFSEIETLGSKCLPVSVGASKKLTYIWTTILCLEMLFLRGLTAPLFGSVFRRRKLDF